MPHKTHCPLCRKPTDPAFAPFCGRGCRDRDFLAWTGETYRAPGPPLDEHGDGPGQRALYRDEDD